MYHVLRALCVTAIISYVFLTPVSATNTADVGSGNFRKRQRDFTKGEILVKFRENSSDYSIMSTIELLGEGPAGTTGPAPYHLVDLRRGQHVEEAVEAFMRMPNVEHAQPNYQYRLHATMPNDPSYAQLWGLKNTGQTIENPSYYTHNPGTPGIDMDMELAWDHVTDCDSMIVAVIDTGVNYNHDDLAMNMWEGTSLHGYDFVDDDDDPMDLNGHGTHVAGTIGAVGDNDTGTTGVCWQVRIMAVRSFNEAGRGTTADIISGIYYAVNNGAHIVNMSFGQPNFDQALYNAIAYAKEHNVIAIASAGNNGSNNDDDNHQYPSDFDLDNLVSVAALDQNYGLASFSSYGPTSVDVGAPGTNIMSALCGTKNVDVISLSNGWTEGGTQGWAYGSRDLGNGDQDFLLDPWNWGPTAWGSYSNNAQDKIWTSFDLSGEDVAVFRYWIWHDLERGFDAFYCACDSVDGDPFVNGYTLGGWTGSTEGYFYLDQWIIPGTYLTSPFSIGFGLYSDVVNAESGVAIQAVSLSTISLNNDSYDVKNGTSMAAPHVSGLAAMIWVFNPDYTYREVIESILYGGEAVSSLSGITTSGNAVNAWGSLRYIKPPTGVTVTYQ